MESVTEQNIVSHDNLVVRPQDMPERSRRMITPAQIRAALGLLDWDVKRLASEAGIAEGTVRRAMRGGRLIHDNLVKIQQALERGGALFLDPGDVRTGGEGLRLRRP